MLVNECDLFAVMYTEHVSINQLSTMFVYCITFQHDYLPKAPLSRIAWMEQKQIGRSSTAHPKRSLSNRASARVSNVTNMTAIGH